MDSTRARALLGAVVVAAVGGVVAATPRTPRAVGDVHVGVDVDAHRAWLAGHKLDLNVVDARDLERIPGIGPALAGRIIAARDARGGFDDINDVDGVEGVGPKLLAKIAAYCEVKPR